MSTTRQTTWISYPLGAGGIIELQGSGPPTDGVTGNNTAGIGSRYTDTTNGAFYIQTGVISSTVWKGASLLG